MSWRTRVWLTILTAVFGATVVAGTFIYANMAITSRMRLEKVEEAILEIKDLNRLYGTEQVLQAKELRDLQVKLAELLLVREHFQVKPK